MRGRAGRVRWVGGGRVGVRDEREERLRWVGGGWGWRGLMMERVDDLYCRPAIFGHGTSIQGTT
jgi:hypothetical protein